MHFPHCSRRGRPDEMREYVGREIRFKGKGKRKRRVVVREEGLIVDGKVM